MSELAVSVKGVGRMFGIGTQRRTVGEGLRYWVRGHYPQRLFWALKDISFDVPRGEGLALIGPNGAGKSVLLRIISGILPPTEGMVSTSGTVNPFLSLGGGLVPQLTVMANLRLCAALLGYTDRQFRTRLERVIEFGELHDYLYASAMDLSKGWLLRVAFSIALFMDMDILLIDEVLAVGDDYFKAKCYSRFDKIKKEGKTFIVASHNEHEIRKTCEKALYLDGGRFIAYGPMDEVLPRYLEDVRRRTDKLQ